VELRDTRRLRRAARDTHTGYDRFGGLRSFAIGRDRAFSADEMVLAGRIRRLLIGLNRLAEVLTTLRPTAVDAVADIRISPRELAVIGLLAEGLTAASIGRRLAISERTVHKHLEHVYAKLGVSDRLPAVPRARGCGLIPA
jgi:DNA-binding NarL/FixJ family response regulator